MTHSSVRSVTSESVQPIDLLSPTIKAVWPETGMAMAQPLPLSFIPSWTSRHRPTYAPDSFITGSHTYRSMSTLVPQFLGLGVHRSEHSSKGKPLPMVPD
jgi:hypothetical protein